MKYYLIVDAQFKKVEIYEAVNGQYQPIAINPQTFRFELKEGCSIEIDLTDIWD